MKKFNLSIDLNTIGCHSQLVKSLSLKEVPQKGDEVHIEIDLNTEGLLLADFLTLIVCVIYSFKNKGVKITGKFLNFKRSSNKIKYASRVDFFKHLKFAFQEDFQRRNSSGRFIEIKKFDDDNSLTVFKDIMKILINKGIDEGLLTALDFCLYEVIDNTLNHAGPNFEYGEGEGYIFAQHFPTFKEIRIIIADDGIGIHRALTKHPETLYSHYTEEEAVKHCIDNGVTNSTGKGFGLWSTSEMIKQNKGELVIHSGNYSLKCNSKNEINKESFWDGTYTFIKLNTDVSVNVDNIFEAGHTQRDSYNELKEELLEDLSDLW